jgi:hypothetical protein
MCSDAPQRLGDDPALIEGRDDNRQVDQWVAPGTEVLRQQ